MEELGLTEVLQDTEEEGEKEEEALLPSTFVDRPSKSVLVYADYVCVLCALMYMYILQCVVC